MVPTLSELEHSQQYSTLSYGQMPINSWKDLKGHIKMYARLRNLVFSKLSKIVVMVLQNYQEKKMIIWEGKKADAECYR